MKKIFIFFAAIFLAFSLTACSAEDIQDILDNIELPNIGEGNGENISGNPVTNPKEETVNPTQPAEENLDRTIVFYTMISSSLLDEVGVAVEQFSKKFPGWNIEVNQISGYENLDKKLKSDLSNNKQPDLVYIYNDCVLEYLPSNKVLTFNEFINNEDKLTVSVYDNGKYVYKTYDEQIGYSEEELNDFVQNIFDAGYAKNFVTASDYGYRDDDLLLMPAVKNAEVLYYNKDALEELGVSVPQTWEELWEICAMAKEKWPNSIPLGYDNAENLVFDMYGRNSWEYTTNEYPYIAMNDYRTVNWLNDLKTYYDKGYFTTQAVLGGYSSNKFILGPQNGGHILSVSNSASCYHYYTDNFKTAVTAVPGTYVDGNLVRKANAYDPSYIMFETDKSNDDERKLMTWEFVKLLLEPEMMAKLAGDSGHVPVRYSAYETPYYRELLSNSGNIRVDAINAVRENIDALYNTKVFPKSLQVRENLDIALQYMFINQITPEETFNYAIKN